ncbi:hypothetical protein NDU88_005513 [Pleurodeles waltl]|uniref:Uncharacterized protein n=1 Tax=Pleurodeles waltl TaxID=8319 RepID=A0AAV7RL94_PLEWA|nr:hypothetical protein NDU88_005513 [Pleurodeles waltl]
MLGVSCRLRLLIRTRHLLFDGRLRYRARLFAVFDKSGQLHSVAHGYAHIPVETPKPGLLTSALPILGVPTWPVNFGIA